MSTLALYRIISKNGNIIFSCSPEFAQEMSNKGNTVNASIRKYKIGGF